GPATTRRSRWTRGGCGNSSPPWHDPLHPGRRRGNLPRMKTSRVSRVAALLVLLVIPGTVRAQEPQLIPRRVLFGNPQRMQVLISPDGKHLSYLAPVEGVMNVWVAPADKPEAARPITNDRNRGIREHFWAY